MRDRLNKLDRLGGRNRLIRVYGLNVLDVLDRVSILNSVGEWCIKRGASGWNVRDSLGRLVE